MAAWGYTSSAVDDGYPEGELRRPAQRPPMIQREPVRRLASQGMVRPTLFSAPFYVTEPAELSPMEGGPGMYALTKDVYAPRPEWIDTLSQMARRPVPSFRPNHRLSNPGLR